MKIPAVWHLPGPQFFLQELMDDIRDGNWLVVHLGPSAPCDLAERLRTALRQDERHAETILASASPLADVLSTLPGVHDDPATVETLIKACEFSPKVFIVAINRMETWGPWQEFILKLRRRIVQIDAARRPVAAVVLNGFRGCQLPSDDVALRVHRWDGVISEADVLAMAYATCTRLVQPRQVKRVLVHTLARVALWDRELLEDISRGTPESFLNPRPVLERFARARGWSSLTEESEEAGTVATIGGQTEVHSALLAVTGRAAQLAQRTWMAQATVLLPWVEEERLELLNDVRRFLEPLISRPLEEAEIGEMAHALWKTNAPRALRERAQQLCDVRNEIAHRRTLTYAKLCAVAGQDAKR